MSRVFAEAIRTLLIEAYEGSGQPWFSDRSLVSKPSRPEP